MPSQRKGWGPLTIGLVLLPAAVSAVVVTRLVGRMLLTIGARRGAAALGALSGTGLLIAAVSTHPPSTLVGLAAAVSGFAGGQVALLGAVPALVPKALTSTAIAVFNLVFIAGGSLGSAAAGGIADAASLGTAAGAVAVLPFAGAVIAWRLPVPAAAAGTGEQGLPRRAAGASGSP